MVEVKWVMAVMETGMAVMKAEMTKIKMEIAEMKSATCLRGILQW